MDYIEKIDRTLNRLFEQYQKSINNPGVLLSGGIDSSIISFFVKKYFSNFTLLSFGSQNSDDKPYISIMSQYLKKESVWLEVSEKEIADNLQQVQMMLKSSGVEDSLTNASLALGYFLIFQKANQMKIEKIFTGQGPDILLAGYHRYKNLSDTEITKAIQNDLPLLEIDKRRDRAMASRFNVELVSPYLEDNFVNLSLGIPSEYKIKGGVEKYILREYGKKIGIPNQITSRPKHAFQYSTGIQKLVKLVSLTRPGLTRLNF